MIKKEEIAKACEKCRNAMIQIQVAGPHEEWVGMTLPILYQDNTIASILIFPCDGANRVTVSDGGGIARRQRLTKEEIEAMCKRRNLEHTYIYEGNDTPCDCDIYIAVAFRDMQQAVLSITGAIMESFRIKEESTRRQVNERLQRARTSLRDIS